MFEKFDINERVTDLLNKYELPSSPFIETLKEDSKVHIITASNYTDTILAPLKNFDEEIHLSNYASFTEKPKAEFAVIIADEADLNKAIEIRHRLDEKWVVLCLLQPEIRMIDEWKPHFNSILPLSQKNPQTAIQSLLHFLMPLLECSFNVIHLDLTDYQYMFESTYILSSTSTARGEPNSSRSKIAVENALADLALPIQKAVLIHIQSDFDLGLEEFELINEIVHSQMQENTLKVCANTLDPNLQDNIIISLYTAAR